MRHFLLLAIRFHDGRYHGAAEWPPSPARVFQALVAAAARGASAPEEAKAALQWLEALDAPMIAAPKARNGAAFVTYVPNNDLDAVGGDVRRIDKIRAPKFIRPRLFNSKAPLLYSWTFKEAGNGKKHADEICNIAQDLYQLGRGVDMAWAHADILSQEEAEHRLAAHGGSIHRPASRGTNATLACPAAGSLQSLLVRHAAASKRFETRTASAQTKYEPNKTKPAGQLFQQPPKPRFRQVAYDCPPTRLLFDLSPQGAAWPFTQPAALVERVRDAAAIRVSDAMPPQNALIQRVFVGSKQSSESDKAERVRIIPLPSIGHQHADRAIRRILVEIPPNCPLAAGDIEWAFSGLDVSDINPVTGEVTERVLTGAASQKMLEHYGVEAEAPSKTWRTVTPAALPDHARRRRIDPARLKEEAKSGAERRSELERAASAVQAALRHAGITATLDAVRLQREPFEVRGASAEEFAPGTRFSKHQLWHVELAFDEPISGPLVIGDGRYLGLGLMAPAPEAPQKVLEFTISGEKPVSSRDRVEFLRAVRRALMALDREYGGEGAVSRLFSGHEKDGAPARSGKHEHVFLATRSNGDHLSTLLIFSPDLVDRKSALRQRQVQCFSDVAKRLDIVRAGRLGVVRLIKKSSIEVAPQELAQSKEWVSSTPYVPTLHLKPREDAATHIARDVLIECVRRGLPKPEIDVLQVDRRSRSKLQARVRLRFQRALNGPILIGQGSHFGWGLFLPASD
jgi:CRISPR-associated protein Csb2